MTEPTPKNPNRIDALAPPATTPDPPLHPFTTPLIPGRWVAWAAALVAIAAVLIPIVPPGPIQAVLSVLVSLGAALGIASPGLQKRAAPPVIDDRETS